MIKIIKSTELDLNGAMKHPERNKEIAAAVSAIIEDVIKRGDTALREYTKKFDKCLINKFQLSTVAVNKAVKSVDAGFIKIMEQAAENIESYHRNQINTGFDLLPKDGVILGQKVTPIETVACYIPGGTASYPSSVLMNCIPAKIAGVKDIIIVTPPASAKTVKSGDASNACNGVDPHILAAAKIAGVNKFFTIGGAQAIAAFAYGTQTVPRADKITGPGNAYVTEAKRQVYGIVGIDALAGPSDILVIADKSTDPRLAAADMLSQCEHGEDSKAVLITDSMTFARKVRAEIKAQLPALPRRTIAEKAINDNSMIILVKSLDEAFDISNELAPEHLEILLDEPFNYLSKVKNAGSVFLGKYSPETIGDYYAGPNHVLPTSGTARFRSPLMVDDFIKKTSYTYYSEEALLSRSADIIRFAKEEGFDAHAACVEKRLKD